MLLNRAPFDTAFLVYIVMIAFIYFNWTENYGDANAQIKQSFIRAWTSIKSGKIQIEFINKLLAKINMF